MPSTSCSTTPGRPLTRPPTTSGSRSRSWSSARPGPTTSSSTGSTTRTTRSMSSPSQKKWRDAPDPPQTLEGTAELVTLTPTMTLEQRLAALRQNALVAHQHAVGLGDQLIEILERAISQMERTHSRVLGMSMALFDSCVLLIVTAAGQVVVGCEAL